MSVKQNENAIVLTGSCGVEEVETLVEFLENGPHLVVDLSAATAIHTALWQALMIFRPTLAGSAASPDPAGKIVPALSAYLAASGRILIVELAMGFPSK